MPAAANPAEFRPAPGWHRGGLGVLALHLALLGLWRQALHQTEVAVPPAATAPLVWLNLPASPVPATASPRREPTRPLAVPARPRAPAAEHPAPQPAPLQWSAPAAAEALSAATPAPSAPAPSRGRLLDSAATQAAIREAARQPLLSERAASATGIAPRTDAQRLSEGVSQAAKGDCLRDPAVTQIGPIGLGGLLGLPGLAARVISGDCPR